MLNEQLPRDQGWVPAWSPRRRPTRHRAAGARGPARSCSGSPSPRSWGWWRSPPSPPAASCRRWSALHLPRVAAVAVFLATYLVIAVGKLPGFRLDRAGAALLGASLMVAAGALPLDEAYRAIDLDTMTLLLGMMIVVANLRLSGFFRLVNAWAVTRAGHPLVLLAAVTLTSGVLSAFLVNDAICLVLTPLVLDLVARLRARPGPLPAGGRDGVQRRQHRHDHRQPAEHHDRQLLRHPLRDVRRGARPGGRRSACVLTVLLIALALPRRVLDQASGSRREAEPARVHVPLVTKASLVDARHDGAVLRRPAAGQGRDRRRAPSCCSPGGVKPEKVYREIDWPLLLMFAGLFVVVAGFEKAVLTPDAIAAVGRPAPRPRAGAEPWSPPSCRTWSATCRRCWS